MGADPVGIAAIGAATGTREHHMFAGKLERKYLGRRQPTALRVFRGLEGDLRDWTEIDQWASSIADGLPPEEP